MLACSTLAAAGSGKSGCPSCFADASERGVQVAVLLLLEARRSGCCVGVCGGVRDNPAFLVLAFGTGTLKGSGVPARPVQGGGFCASMLALVCSTPACPGLLVVVRFRAVHRCCLLGYCIPLSPSSLSCLHCVGLQQFGEREGLSEQRALGCFRFHASLVVLRVLPGAGAGSEVRGEGLRCSQAAVVLAYEVQVTVSVLVCLATLLSPSVLLSFLICRGRSGPETPAFCRAAGHGAPREASCELCLCRVFWQCLMHAGFIWASLEA